MTISTLQVDDNDDNNKKKNNIKKNKKVDKQYFTEEQEIRMPTDFGVGKVKRWYINEGEVINYGDVMLDVETEDFEFGMSHDEEERALMHHIAVQVDEDVHEGGLLCVILREIVPSKDNDTPKSDNEDSAKP